MWILCHPSHHGQPSVPEIREGTEQELHHFLPAGGTYVPPVRVRARGSHAICRGCPPPSPPTPQLPLSHCASSLGHDVLPLLTGQFAMAHDRLITSVGLIMDFLSQEAGNCMCITVTPSPRSLGSFIVLHPSLGPSFCAVTVMSFLFLSCPQYPVPTAPHAGRHVHCALLAETVSHSVEGTMPCPSGRSHLPALHTGVTSGEDMCRTAVRGSNLKFRLE